MPPTIEPRMDGGQYIGEIARVIGKIRELGTSYDKVKSSTSQLVLTTNGFEERLKSAVVEIEKGVNAEIKFNSQMKVTSATIKANATQQAALEAQIRKTTAATREATAEQNKRATAASTAERAVAPLRAGSKSPGTDAEKLALDKRINALQEVLRKELEAERTTQLEIQRIRGSSLTGYKQQATEAARAIQVEFLKVRDAQANLGKTVRDEAAKTSKKQREEAEKAAKVAQTLLEKRVAATQKASIKRIADQRKAIDAEIAGEERAVKAAESAATKKLAADRKFIAKRIELARKVTAERLKLFQKETAAAEAAARKQAEVQAKVSANVRQRGRANTFTGDIRRAAGGQILRAPVPARAQFTAALGALNDFAAKTGATVDRLKQLYAGAQRGIDLSMNKLERGVVTRSNAVIAAQTGLTTATAKMQKNVSNDLKQITLSWQSMARLIAASLVRRAIFSMIAAIREGVEATTELEIKLAEVRTISQQNQLATDEWSAGLRELSDAFGVPILDQVEAAYQTLSNQIADGAEAFEFLASANKFALAAVTDSSTAVNLLSSAINAYGLDIEDADQVSAQFFKTIELGRIRADELANNFGRVAVPANTLGISLDEVQASLATLTIRGIPANVAMTQLRGLMLKLIKPTGDMKDFLSELGVETGQAAIQTFGFTGFLDLLEKKTKGNVGELGKLVNRMRGIQGAIGLTGEAGKDFNRTRQEILSGSEDFAKAQELVLRSTGKQLQIQANEVKNYFVEEVGRDVLQVTLDITNSFGTLEELTRSFARTLVLVLIPATVLATKSLLALSASFPVTAAIASAIIILQSLSLAIVKLQSASEAAAAAEKKASQDRIDAVRKEVLERGKLASKQLSDLARLNRLAVAETTKGINAQLKILAAATESFDDLIEAGIKGTTESLKEQIKELEKEGKGITTTLKNARKALKTLREETADSILSRTLDTVPFEQALDEIANRQEALAREREAQERLGNNQRVLDILEAESKLDDERTKLIDKNRQRNEVANNKTLKELKDLRSEIREIQSTESEGLLLKGIEDTDIATQIKAIKALQVITGLEATNALKAGNVEAAKDLADKLQEVFELRVDLINKANDEEIKAGDQKRKLELQRIKAQEKAKADIGKITRESNLELRRAERTSVGLDREIKKRKILEDFVKKTAVVREKQKVTEDDIARKVKAVKDIHVEDVDLAKEQKAVNAERVKILEAAAKQVQARLIEQESREERLVEFSKTKLANAKAREAVMLRIIDSQEKAEARVTSTLAKRKLLLIDLEKAAKAVKDFDIEDFLKEQDFSTDEGRKKAQDDIKQRLEDTVKLTKLELEADAKRAETQALLNKLQAASEAIEREHLRGTIKESSEILTEKLKIADELIKLQTKETAQVKAQNQALKESITILTKNRGNLEDFLNLGQTKAIRGSVLDSFIETLKGFETGKTSLKELQSVFKQLQTLGPKQGKELEEISKLVDPLGTGIFIPGSKRANQRDQLQEIATLLASGELLAEQAAKVVKAEVALQKVIDEANRAKGLHTLLINSISAAERNTAENSEKIKTTWERIREVMSEVVDEQTKLGLLGAGVLPVDFKREPKAAGGPIHGRDSVPALLSPGEFVVNSKASKRFYTQLLSMNSGVRRFAEGGPVTNVGDINVNMSSTGVPSKDVAEIGRLLKREIRRGTFKF